MSYTVKKLAMLSGVSIKTLHFYDKSDLLKPAYYGSNGYRYYEKEQLLILQQILFFRELGFPLNKIKHILVADDFNKIQTLQSHKQLLQQRLNQTTKLIHTVDKTITYLQGEQEMQANEMFEGFEPENQIKYNQIAIENLGDIALTLIDRRNRRIAHWQKEDWSNLKKKAHEISVGMLALMEEDVDPGDLRVQELMRILYQEMEIMYAPNKEEYMIICILNCEHPEFRVQFDYYHENLAEYILAAAKLFAKAKL